MRATSADGTGIDFETAGDGSPLVLLHGFFGDRTSWRSAGYVDALAGKFLLVLIDGRGHGRSDAPRDGDSYRIERQVQDVLAVLDALGLDQAAFWGSSMGGRIGLHLLASHPRRLTALIAGGAHAEPVPVDPAEVEREANLFRTQGTAPFITWLERQGQVPTWLREGTLSGDQDPRLPATESTATRIPSATLVRLPDCGHLDTFARTDLTLPIVLPFLSEHPGQPRA